MTTAMPAAADRYGPDVQTVSPNTPVEDLIYLLKRDGGVFVKNFVPGPDVDQAFSECRERLENDVEWKGSFFPSRPPYPGGRLLLILRVRANTKSSGPYCPESYIYTDSAHAPRVSKDLRALPHHA